MDIEKYEAFEKRLKDKYPAMFSQPYGGICVGEGWWPILEVLCGHIDSYTKWINNTRAARLKENMHNLVVPDEVPQVVVAQIKEKFGSLRFYYDGGDNYIRGLVTMAESWASHTCEVCGELGTARHGGWIKTLCDEHDAERKKRYDTA